MDESKTTIERESNLPAIPYEIRRYITIQKAIGTPNPEIEALVLDKYNVEVKRRDITNHLPSANPDMPTALVELFHATRKNLEDSLQHLGIAQKTQRILEKDKRWQKLKEIVELRALDAQNNGNETDLAMGMGTGLVVKTRQAIGGDEIDEVYKISTDILTAMEDLETSAAKELGQLNTGANINIQKAIIGVNLDEV